MTLTNLNLLSTSADELVALICGPKGNDAEESETKKRSHPQAEEQNEASCDQGDEDNDESKKKKLKVQEDEGELGVADDETQELVGARLVVYYCLVCRTLKYFKIFRLPVSILESAPRIAVYTLDTVESCVHEVAVPPGQEYVQLKKPNRDPAKTYPFTLDPFQEQVRLVLGVMVIGSTFTIRLAKETKFFDNCAC